VNEPVAHNCESQPSVETERCVPSVGPEHSDVVLPEFSDDVVKKLAPDATAVHCRLYRHEAELHGGNVRRQRARTRIEACDTRECARAPGPQMPGVGQVVLLGMRRGEVSITEYSRSEVVGVSDGDMLNLDDGQGAILNDNPARLSRGRETAGEDSATQCHKAVGGPRCCLRGLPQRRL